MTVSDMHGRPVEVGHLVIQRVWDASKGAILTNADARGLVRALGRTRALVDLTNGPYRVHGSALEIVGCVDCGAPATHRDNPREPTIGFRPIFVCSQHASDQAKPVT